MPNPPSETIHVTNASHTDDGTPAEPEQQTVTRVIPTAAEAGGTMTGPQGEIPTNIVIQNPVAQLLQPLRNPCAYCAYFDNEGFISFLARADQPDAPLLHRETVNQIRAGLLQTQNANMASMSTGVDGDLDVEHALRLLGFCQALGEIVKDYVVVHPVGSCPQETITPTEPNGLFKPRDRAGERAGNAAYDRLIDVARGNKP